MKDKYLLKPFEPDPGTIARPRQCKDQSLMAVLEANRALVVKNRKLYGEANHYAELAKILGMEAAKQKRDADFWRFLTIVIGVIYVVVPGLIIAKVMLG